MLESQFNPDAVVVRVNVGRALAREPFDGAYLAGLSADAVPALAARLDSLPEGLRCDVARRLAQRGDLDAAPDWRRWSLARSEARRAMGRVDLARLGCHWGLPGAAESARPLSGSAAPPPH